MAAVTTGRGLRLRVGRWYAMRRRRGLLAYVAGRHRCHGSEPFPYRALVYSVVRPGVARAIVGAELYYTARGGYDLVGLEDNRDLVRRVRAPTTPTWRSRGRARG